MIFILIILANRYRFGKHNPLTPKEKMMIERQVTHTQKDGAGDILALCNPSSVWRYRAKAEAIKDIDNRSVVYYVQWPGGKRTDIHVANGPNGRYLRTDHDDTSRNNLDDLPDCRA